MNVCSCRAVIFDLFGTLVYPLDADLLNESIWEMAKAVKVDYERFREWWMVHAWSGRITGYFRTVEETVAWICNELGHSPDRVQLARSAEIRWAFMARSISPRPDAVSALAAIAEHGMKLGLISDCSWEVPGIWTSTPFARFIEAPVFSCAVGLKKPDPEIYQTACRLLDISPHACLYVGDGFNEELAGALNAGMRAVLIRPLGETPPKGIKWEGETWTGDRIENLSETLPFLDMPIQ